MQKCCEIRSQNLVLKLLLWLCFDFASRNGSELPEKLVDSNRVHLYHPLEVLVAVEVLRNRQLFRNRSAFFLFLFFNKKSDFWYSLHSVRFDSQEEMVIFHYKYVSIDLDKLTQVSEVNSRSRIAHCAVTWRENRLILPFLIRKISWSTGI